MEKTLKLENGKMIKDMEYYNGNYNEKRTIEYSMLIEVEGYKFTVIYEYNPDVLDGTEENGEPYDDMGNWNWDDFINTYIEESYHDYEIKDYNITGVAEGTVTIDINE